MSHHSPQLGNRRVPGTKRTIPVKGIGEDEDLYFRCWYCGFVDKADRNELGGELSRSGLQHEDHNLVARGANGSGDPRTIVSMLSGFSSLMHATKGLELGADGEPKGILHSHLAKGSGCSFCHSRNWK